LQQVTYSGSNRNVDEYNRIGRSKYELIDSISDIIVLDSVKGVYPDSLVVEDYELTKKLQRFDDYDITTNEAFWAGYRAGRSDWGWYSPWYYSRYGWYGGWYDPWYYGSSYWFWNDPWYYGNYWYWNDPWYYGYAYYPYSGYYGYYGWGYPYYHGYYGGHYIGGGGSGRRYAHNGNSGTIDLRGGSRVVRHNTGSGGSGGYNRGSGRESSLRNRTVGAANRVTSGRAGGRTVGNSTYSGGGGGSTSRSSGSFNGGSRMGGGSYSGSSGGSSVSRSSGGGGGGGGASRGGGGGGGGSRGGRR
jgi:hypothetical protein